jgi:dTDP-4-dehydrorhamnose reductase
MALYDRIMITGGGGMLAYAFGEVLKAREARGAKGARATSLPRGACDIAHPEQVADAFKQHKPTLVINCAAYTKVDLAEKERDAAMACNAIAPGIVADLCRKSGAALVHFSTDYVFDGKTNRPLRPDDPVGPQSAYGQTKLEGERNLQKHAPPHWLVARTAWLYGPNGANFVRTMVNAAKAGKPLTVINDQVGCPTYTFDLAEATLDLLDAGATGVWHVANAGQTSWFEFARAIFEEWNLHPDLRPTTSEQWKATKPDSATRPAYSVFDLAPLAEKLGRPMRPWREALRAFKTAVDSSGGF